VRETPIKRFDRKDMMERDLERYRAEARARLLKNGFDIPAFLMPRRRRNPDEEEVAQNPDHMADAELQQPAMIGPKPTMPVRHEKLPDAKQERDGTVAKIKPRRHVYVQNKGVGLLSMFLPDDVKAGVAASAAGQVAAIQDPAAHAAAQKAAIAEERTAYEEYVESLNGGKTLLDRVRGDEGDTQSSTGNTGQNDIAGRVDDFKQAEMRTSRINLPDSDSNWAMQEDLDAKRMALLQKQGKSGARSAKEHNKARKQTRSPMNWNKMIARLAAYMIAAVAVGYVLVLTFNEFAAIIGR
jgi:hypothetical protein